MGTPWYTSEFLLAWYSDICAVWGLFLMWTQLNCKYAQYKTLQWFCMYVDGHMIFSHIYLAYISKQPFPLAVLFTCGCGFCALGANLVQSVYPKAHMFLIMCSWLVEMQHETATSLFVKNQTILSQNFCVSLICLTLVCTYECRRCFHISSLLFSFFH